ncbi:Protein of unknown function [Gryllus bimaculatus]|nr:Protein of unknown function [Gryllus bimaculatus]
MYRQGQPGMMQGRPNTNGLYSPGITQNQRYGGNPMMAQNQQNPYRSPSMTPNQPMMRNPMQSPMRGQYPPQAPMQRPCAGNPYSSSPACISNGTYLKYQEI